MAKRRNGEGTWGTKNIKGTQYKYFRSSEGKYFYGKTEKEINQKRKAYEQNKTPKITSSILVSDFLVQWLREVKKPHIKKKTYDGYEDFINMMIINYKEYSIADIALDKLDSKIINKFYKSLAKHYALSTIQKIHTLLRQSMDYAVDEELIESSPMKKVSLPSSDTVEKKKKDIPFLPIEDIEKLYNECYRVQTEDYLINGSPGKSIYGVNAKIIVLIMYTGLRFSEAAGLKWEDVHFDEKYISIKRNLSRVRKDEDEKKDKASKTNEYTLVETTAKFESMRNVPLCDRAYEVLEYLKQHNCKTKPSDYVCISKNGENVAHRNLTRTLHSMLKRSRCSVSECGLHSLRHSFGSYLFSQGIDIAIVSKLLGHKDVSTTYNIYIHVLQQQQIDAVSIFNKKEDVEK